MAMQVHEWGGVFADIITYSHLRQLRPGLRIVVNPHGGHYWSTQGQLPRPSDIVRAPQLPAVAYFPPVTSFHVIQLTFYM